MPAPAAEQGVQGQQQACCSSSSDGCCKPHVVWRGLLQYSGTGEGPAAAACAALHVLPCSVRYTSLMISCQQHPYSAALTK
jgi:hypothetical protein